MSDNEQTISANKSSDKPLRAMDVLQFLRQYPAFFSQHPDLLTQLQVVDEQGAVANLLNYQVKVLQEKNNQLKAQLADMVAAVRNNQGLLDKVFDLALVFSTLDPNQPTLNAFVDYVKQAFPSDFLALAIDRRLVTPNTRMTHVTTISDTDHFRCLFEDALDQPLCGRLKVDKLEFLFAKKAPEVASVALIPLGDKAQGGLLAFGSTDQHRFVPGMSTDILQRLAQLLYHKLQWGMAATASCNTPADHA